MDTDGPQWSRTDDGAELELSGDGTLTYDAETDTVRVVTGATTSALAARGLVRIVVSSASGTIVLTGTIRLTSTGLVIRAREVVVTAGSTIDTTGAAGDGDITLAASATGSGPDASASSTVTVRGATLKGRDISITASSATTGSATGPDATVRGSSSARVLVLDSLLVASGAVTLGTTSRATGSASAVGTVAQGSTSADAARASVVLASLAETRLGGISRVTSDGALSLLAVNATDARSVGDASGATAGGGTATAAVERTTRAVLDGSALLGLRVGRLGIDASSSGRLFVSSEGNAAGATSNTTPPISLTVAATGTDGPVRSAAALGLGRVASLTEAILASGDGQVLRLSADGDTRVSARSTDSSTVAADAAASALGAAVAVILPTVLTRASVNGALDVEGGLLVVRSDLTDHSDATATGGRGGALAVGLGTRSSAAELGSDAAVGGDLGALDLVATSTTATTGTSSAASGPAGSLAVVVVDGDTLAGLRDGASLTGTRDLTVTATSQDRSTADATRGAGPGRAVVLVTVSTDARLGTGAALVLPGSLRLTAEQAAAATSAASLLALTLATHDVSASSGRAVRTGGAVSMTATGDSRTSSRAPGLAGSGTTTTLAALLAVRALADTLARSSGQGGSALLTTTAPSTLPLASVAATIVRGSATVDLPALPVRAGGPVDLLAVAGGNGAAGTGGNGGGSAPSSSVALVLAILPSKVRVAGTLQSEEDLLLQAGRGPPAVESSTSTAPSGSAAILLVQRPTTVEILAPVTAGSGSTVTIVSGSTAPVEASGLPGSTAPQTSTAPPAGSVLVTALAGGTVTSGRATLTFAPGSLPADAFVVIRAERRYVPGLRTVSLVYDLLAWDARTGAPITHFRAAPVLTIGVDGGSGAAIWYLAPDGGLEMLPTAAGHGSLSAALPHFSPFVAGTPLDGIAGLIIPLLQSYLADALSGPRTEVLPDLDLGVFVLTSPTVTFSGISGSAGSYTVTVSLSGRVTLGFVDGTTPVGGSANLTGSYTVDAEALDAGDLALTLTDLVLTLGDALTLRAASATLAQVGSDLTLTAGPVTAVLAVPGGPALTVTATSLDLLVKANRQVAFRVAGGTVALTGVPGVTAVGTGWTVVHNATGADATLGSTLVTSTPGFVATGGTTTLAVAGQSLTATTLTVQRSGGTLTLAATGLGLTLSVGSGDVLVVTLGTGTLVVDALGVAGSLSATASTGTGFTLATLAAASVSLAVNTRSIPAAGLPAGPFVRVVATGVTLTVGTGQVAHRLGLLRAAERHGRHPGRRPRPRRDHRHGRRHRAAHRRRWPARRPGQRSRGGRLRPRRVGRRLRLLRRRAPAGQHHGWRGRAVPRPRRPGPRPVVHRRRGRGQPHRGLRALGHRRRPRHRGHRDGQG